MASTRSSEAKGRTIKSDARDGDKIASRQADPRTQSERFIAKARELGLDEREETFDAALTKVARRKPVEAPERPPKGMRR